MPQNKFKQPINVSKNFAITIDSRPAYIEEIKIVILSSFPFSRNVLVVLKKQLSTDWILRYPLT